MLWDFCDFLDFCDFQNFRDFCYFQKFWDFHDFCEFRDFCEFPDFWDFHDFWDFQTFVTFGTFVTQKTVLCILTMFCHLLYSYTLYKPYLFFVHELLISVRISFIFVTVLLLMIFGYFFYFSRHLTQKLGLNFTSDGIRAVETGDADPFKRYIIYNYVSTSNYQPCIVSYFKPPIGSNSYSLQTNVKRQNTNYSHII